MTRFDDARRDLDAWRAALPADPYRADTALATLNRSALSSERLEALEATAVEFGRKILTEIGPLAARYEQRAHLPELERWDGIGRRTERVVFDPAYHRAGEVAWGSGAVAESGTPGRAFEQATLLYLLSLEGEAGHSCPATCTIGLARALRRKAETHVRDRFLPPLLDRDYHRAERGSQFLTEVQGGSDVGANATRAEPAGDGTYRITGEKWFCSVADAEQFLVTARVPGDAPGTRGLGCLVVPRRVDGALNGFSIRRLKDKLGTRGLASGEIDFDAALAWPIGPVEEGFKTAVGVVLNTSRWMTALGSTGMMRRAVLEAEAYARHRRAFGAAIVDYPMVRLTLAGMKAGWLASLASCWQLTALEDTVDAGHASDDDVARYRFLVNAAKYWASLRATRVVHDAIEVLGGNGAIESFSVLPRLYRDSIVYESWEGSHNVLCVQVLADFGRLGSLHLVADWIDDWLGSGTGAEITATRTALKETLAATERALADPDEAAVHGRRLIDRLMAVFDVAVLTDAAARGIPGADACAELLAAALDTGNGTTPPGPALAVADEVLTAH